MISVHWLRFASQLIFVSHDCLNPIGGAPKSQRQVIVYAHERTFLRSMSHCGSVMDLLPEVAFDHKAHRHGRWATKKSTLGLTKIHYEPELKETTSWTTAGQAKDKSSSPNPLVKALWRGCHWVWGPNHRRAIKEWSIVINHDWVHN